MNQASLIEAMLSWLRSRTARERLLLKGAALLIVALIPLAAYQAAARYRADAARDLTEARALQADVARFRAQSGAGGAAATDGTLHGLALANAAAAGLTVARVEPRGADTLFIVFEPADSIRIYRWIDWMARRGAHARRTLLARTSQAGAVSAEFELSTAP